MNLPRLFFSIVAGFVFIFGTSFVIHGFWLDADYRATAALWRPESEMRIRFLWMLGAQLLWSVAIMYVWAKTGWRRRRVTDGAVYGLWIGLLQQITTIVLYVVAPLPGSIAAKWFVVGVVQSVSLGIIAAMIYKPLSSATERRA